jgi:hypothetical protein
MTEKANDIGQSRSSGTVKVAQPRSLLVLFLLGVLGFGILAFLAFRGSSPEPVAGVVVLLAAIGCLGGAAFFGGLARVATATPELLRPEEVVAQGIGRVPGGLAGVVVAATDQRVVSLKASLFGSPTIAVSISYSEIEALERSEQSVTVKAQDRTISLDKCAPNQVTDLVTEIQSRSVRPV